MIMAATSSVVSESHPALLRALEWLLPEPVTPGQVTWANDPAATGGAAIALGGQAPPGLACHRAWRVSPNPALPRFLTPATTPFRHFTALLRPRSRAFPKPFLAGVLARFPILIERRSATIVLATKGESHLAATWRAFAPPERTALFVGYGNGPPRLSIWGFDAGNQVTAIARYASGAAGRARLEREHATLSRLDHLPRFRGTVPAALALEHGHLGTMLVTDAFAGNPGGLDVDPAVQVWLDLCILGPDRPVASSPLLVALEREARSLGESTRAACLAALAALRATVATTTIVHGDFAPWNLLIGRGQARVFDWETAEFDGIPEWDRMYYQLRTGLTVNRWHAARIAAQIREFDRQGSPHYAPAAWRAVLMLSLVNLACKERGVPHRVHIVAMIEHVLADLLAHHWPIPNIS
jgi:hypothetical protein